MDSFDSLIQGCTDFTLDALRAAEAKVSEEFKTSGATRPVIASRVINLQKVVSAVGMFSIFDAELQGVLGCADGFGSAVKILEAQEEHALKQQFIDLQLAINVLKHGHGRSYDRLMKTAGRLPFLIKGHRESFFFEGDVSEVNTLIQVDDNFVKVCAEVIWKVSEVIRTVGLHDA